MTLRRRSSSLLLFGALGAAAYFFLAPRLPKDQSVNVVLGDAAHEVTEVELHYASASNDELARDVDSRFELGKAPRVVHHEARLPDGEYVVALEVKSDRGTWKDERRVRLQGGSTSIDVDPFGAPAREAN